MIGGRPYERLYEQARLPHLTGLPHLPGVPHLHEYDLKNQADKSPRYLHNSWDHTQAKSVFLRANATLRVNADVFPVVSSLHPKRSDDWKYICVRCQTQPRLRDISVFVPFSSNILDYWRHFTTDRKRLLNLVNASWLWRISWGLEAIRNGKNILNEW